MANLISGLREASIAVVSKVEIERTERWGNVNQPYAVYVRVCSYVGFVCLSGCMPYCYRQWLSRAAAALVYISTLSPHTHTQD